MVAFRLKKYGEKILLLWLVVVILRAQVRFTLVVLALPGAQKLPTTEAEIGE